jgi:hypothetical protein
VSESRLEVASSIEGEDLIGDTLGARYTKDARQPQGDELDDFAAAGIESVEDIEKRWVDSFFFGSKSDDRTVAHAFNAKANPRGAKINAIYSSDVGHWDVPDLRQVLAESSRARRWARRCGRARRPDGKGSPRSEEAGREEIAGCEGMAGCEDSERRGGRRSALLPREHR